jgi:signal transduction histidine kinase
MRRWVPGRLDLVIALVLTIAGQIEVWTGFVPAGADQRPVLAVGYLVGMVAVAWHRTAPLTALTVVMTGLVLVPGILGLDASAGLSWFVAAFGVIISAAYHARRPLVALAVTLGMIAASIVVQKGFLVGDIVYGWFLAGGAWLGGWAVRSRTLRAQLSEQRAVLAEHEAQWRADAAVAEERLRIARELHDVISHGISVMTLHAGGVRRLLAPGQVREREVLEAVERTGRESLAEMQRMLGVLRGPADSAEAAVTPGLADVDVLLDAARSAGLDVTLTVSGDVRPLPPGLDLAAYRIVQEAVTNVLRHARAGSLVCTVDHRGSEVVVTVTDDGGGCADGAGGGHGLIGMRERAALYGGEVEAGPRAGGGFAVRAVLPVPVPVVVPEGAS